MPCFYFYGVVTDFPGNCQNRGRNPWFVRLYGYHEWKFREYQGILRRYNEEDANDGGETRSGLVCLYDFLVLCVSYFLVGLVVLNICGQPPQGTSETSTDFQQALLVLGHRIWECEWFRCEQGSSIRGFGNERYPSTPHFLVMMNPCDDGRTYPSLHLKK